MVRETPAEPAPPPGNEQRNEPPPYPAEKARGGSIILRKGWERGVFAGALVAAVVIAILIAWLA